MFGTFLEYAAKAIDPPEVYAYIYNSFIQQTIVNDDDKLGQLSAFLMSLQDVPTDLSEAYCTGVLIGGEVCA